MTRLHRLHTHADRALRCLNNIRPYQAILYVGLVVWSFVSILCNPTSPIVRYMPDWVRVAYIALQGVAPCVSFYGQWVQYRCPDDARMVENGWWIQWAADAAICWSLLVAVTAFMQATDEPSAVFVVWFLVAMAVSAMLLATRDLIGAIRARCIRRRCCARQDAARES
jgi:hypothetical protein